MAKTGDIVKKASVIKGAIGEPVDFLTIVQAAIDAKVIEDEQVVVSFDDKVVILLAYFQLFWPFMEVLYSQGLTSFEGRQIEDIKADGEAYIQKTLSAGISISLDKESSTSVKMSFYVSDDLTCHAKITTTTVGGDTSMVFENLSDLAEYVAPLFVKCELPTHSKADGMGFKRTIK